MFYCGDRCADKSRRGGRVKKNPEECPECGSKMLPMPFSAGSGGAAPFPNRGRAEQEQAEGRR